MGVIGAIISWIVFGLIAGAIARYLVPGPQPMTTFRTIALGIIGSLAGGFVAWLFVGGSPLQASGFILSIIGATAILAFYVHRKRHNQASTVA